ncbi:MAG: lysophospholipid acyltransferase family protein [bacterium]|nr:lysophospholipid acyltransferase family protein [Candidatus Margulisiibacteriota bacterium]
MIYLIKILQFLFKIEFFLPARIALFEMYNFAWFCHIIIRALPIKKLIARNFSLVFPDKETKKLANNLIKNTCYSIMEIMCVPFFKKKHYDLVFNIEGQENLDKGLGRGKGIILLTLHAGNYESAGNALAMKGYKINGILKVTDDPLFEIINKSRKKGGAKLINVLEQDMYKATLKVLADNEIVYLAADTGALDSRHEEFEFLGKRVPVATGWITLAQRSEAAIIPIFVKREGRKNTIKLSPPLSINSNNRETTIRQILDIFENHIKENPDHWGMFLNAYETERMVGIK